MNDPHGQEVASAARAAIGTLILMGFLWFYLHGETWLLAAGLAISYLTVMLINRLGI